MSKFNLQSLSFALILFLLVLMSNSESGLANKFPEVSAIQKTSLAVTAQVSEEPSSFTQTGPGPESKAVKTREADSRSRGRLLSFAVPEAVVLLPPPEIEARAVLVKEIGGSFPLFTKAVSRRWPLASIAKLMTAVVAFEKIGIDKPITLSQAAVATEGTAGDFKAGESFMSGDLIKTLLTVSSNDAAAGLAEYLGYPEFVEAMKNKAEQLRMRETTFFDPVGLSVLNQSSIEDLEKLLIYILDHHPPIFEITRANALITELNSGKRRLIVNNNKFAGQTDFIGGKTGYTDEAGGNLVSIFSDKNRRFLIIVFGSSDRFGDTEKLYRWMKDNF